jgi:hypothetical protein
VSEQGQVVARALMREIDDAYFAPMKSRPRMPSTVSTWYAVFTIMS